MRLRVTPDAPAKASTSEQFINILHWRSEDGLVVKFDDIEVIRQELVQNRHPIPTGLGTRIYLVGGQEVLLPTTKFSDVIEAVQRHYDSAFPFILSNAAIPTYFRKSAIVGWMSAYNGPGAVYMRSGQTFSLGEFRRSEFEQLLSGNKPTKVQHA